ncbi:hypothetical protein MRX96_034278 [Rhipicephalus microplus]
MDEDSSAIGDDNDDYERLNRATAFAKFVKADDNVATCGELSLDEAVAELLCGDATATLRGKLLRVGSKKVQKKLADFS